MPKEELFKLNVFLLLNNLVHAVSSVSQLFVLRDLRSAVQEQTLYCSEHHKKADYGVECAAMCFDHTSPVWNDDFLTEQKDCILFTYNESLYTETNCMLCMLLNTGEVYQVKTADLVADLVYSTSSDAEGKVNLVKGKRVFSPVNRLETCQVVSH